MAINQNIFGYETVDPVDWSKSVNELSKTILDIGKGREEQKAELDKLKMDNIKLVQQSEGYNSQTFNQKFTSAAQKGRTQLKEWNDMLKRGEITPDEYKLRMNNFTESWGMLGNSIKGFDTKYAEIQKKIQDGTASKASVEAAQYFAKLGELKNLDMFLDENGTWLTGRLDAKTGQVIPDNIESAAAIFNPNNTAFDKINLPEAVQEVTKLWGDEIRESGITTLTDLTQRPAFSDSLSDLVGSLTSNPRMILSILGDNTKEKYQTYYTNDDRMALLSEAVQRENQSRQYQGKDDLSGSELNSFLQKAEGLLIPMKKDSSNVYQPMISQEQLKRAEKAVIDAVEMQLNFKSLEDEKSLSSGGRGSSDEKDKFVSLSQGVIKNWGSASWLNTKARDGYQFKWESGKLNVYKQGSDGRGGTTLSLAGTVKKPEDLGKYIGITNTQNDDWVNAVERARGQTPSTPAKPVKPKPNNNDPLNLGI